jgi:hypothetical protein
MEVADDSIILSEAFVALVARGIANDDRFGGHRDRSHFNTVCQE